jgi:hypothetical protein
MQVNHEHVAAYLDTNVVQDLAGREGQVGDAGRIVQGLVREGSLRVITSIHVVEEICMNLRRDPQEVMRVIEYLETISGPGPIALRPSRLLDLEVEGFFWGIPVEFERKFERISLSYIRERTARSVDRSGNLDQDMDRALDATLRQKTSFTENMRESREKALKLKSANPEWKPTLEEYSRATERSMARSTIERLGYRWELSDTELDDLLGVGSVGTATQVSVGLVHAQAANERNPQAGDSRDMHHSIASSIAGTFVTEDKRLRRALEPNRVAGYRVLSLQELLAVVQ